MTPHRACFRGLPEDRDRYNSCTGWPLRSGLLEKFDRRSPAPASGRPTARNPSEANVSITLPVGSTDGAKRTVEEREEAMSQTPSTTSTENSARTGQGVSVERRFTTPGVHPFDAIEWEIRDAIIGDPADPAFEQRGVEFPATWSQNATNIVAQKYFRGRLGSDRARVVGQADDRPRGRHDRRLGPRPRLLLLRVRRRRLRGRAPPHPSPPDGGLQLARLVQRRLRGEPAVLRLLHPLGRRHDGVDPRAGTPRRE